MSFYCLDSNFFITAWNVSYPIDVFPSLWEELSQYKDQIILIKPMSEEMDPISEYDERELSRQEIEEKYPLNTWLKKNLNPPIKIKDDIENESFKLERKYEIDGKKGANKNDITLIAYAKRNNKTVVTLESYQKDKPKEKRNYKIPLICEEEKVRCIDFVKLLRELNIQI